MSTQGPWSTLANDPRVVIGQPDSDGDNVIIALVQGGRLGHWLPPSHSIPTRGQGEDAARLISAAPDMYEALKAVAAYSGETDLHKPFGGILHLVRAALAKAEGREG